MILRQPTQQAQHTTFGRMPMQDTWCAGIISIVGGLLLLLGTQRRSPWFMRFSKHKTTFEALGPLWASILYYLGGALMVVLGLYLMYGSPG